MATRMGETERMAGPDGIPDEFTVEISEQNRVFVAKRFFLNRAR
jgi:hypothetical protein